MKARMRAEDFGAIVALEEPPLLAHVDRALARRLGLDGGARWSGPEPVGDPHAAPALGAPTEVHLLLNAKCPARCAHCYVDAGPDAAPGADTGTLRHALERLAELGVFHVALGGGESGLRADLLELAAYTRELGLVPNLTTSGVGLKEGDAPGYRVFGQVNLSIDGLGETHRRVRGDTSFSQAERALRWLREAGVRVGVNHVLTRPSWGELDALVGWAAERGACEVEILRLKPVGRAAGPAYEALRLDDAQHRALLPRVLALARATPLHLKLDCSFGPMVFWHDPEPEVVAAFGILGCDGGNSLGAILPDGTLTGCSFWREGDAGGGWDAASSWDNSPTRARFRAWASNAPAPCRDCPWLQRCQGGCHAVAAARAGGFDAPDPECPRVRAHHTRLDTGAPPDHFHPVPAEEEPCR